ncbi:aminoacyl-histidine dipeptidase [Lentiprolixibacter aurantiacus]|uniref:Cytosol non-specific dipeptidase n=1 Tax=Lentiprolixibacter aurantiacus TaxID=2993939 RepID=A0AAE3MP55_9FLAO|nr:aminoacyl-histidine dipeptidase [Lentiprolixibacter aurantiacus]MCX2720427.1 aminoacyl-histidine dipeptidase [Lentiprolixibacter aurantiacus]
MNTVVRKLAPQAVWNNFSDLNAVPRPSKKEERVIAFMMDFGQGLGLETFRDEVGNVIIRKPATSGMENRKVVTLQSHLDMVHQKNTDTKFDFDSEGIVMEVDGDWVRAKGTTLGADNGMGVAAIMSLLQADSIPHPPLEALFTIDEETGMTGAKGLQPGVLKGEILLNLDTEEDDEIDIGCAGGIDITARAAYSENPVAEGGVAYSIKVRGLNGGHSGMDIHKGLGNANKIMNRLLSNALYNFNVQLAEINGGGLRNAIPRESTAIVVIDKTEEGEFRNHFKEWTAAIKSELMLPEPDLVIALEQTSLPEKVMEQEAFGLLVKAVYAAHNGVYRMSPAIADLVETSNNIANVTVQDGKLKIGCLTRSAVESSKMDLAMALKSSFALAGYEVSFSGSYPGWSPNPDSEILEVLKQRYEVLFKSKPKVVACHAGLECGILGQHYPEMDMISFGPTILGAHSPDERVSIPSVQKFWKFLQEILLHIPEKG